MKKILQLTAILIIFFFISSQGNLLLGQEQKISSLEIKELPTTGIRCIGFVTNLGQEQKISSLEIQDRPTTGIVCVSFVTNNNEPLFVIDGIPVERELFETIDTQNIKSITVLKDASATAIYGSKGASGVILVELKKKRKIIKEEVIKKEYKTIKEEGGVKEISLNIFPNPTSDLLNISLDLPKKSLVEINITNLQNLKTHRVIKQAYEAGEQEISWKATSLESGIYSVEITIGNQVIQRKLIIQK
jgi:TonB-dependent SusC/RagA subfamily outer membrane receptor